MKIESCKKKKVVTIRCSDVLLQELHTAIEHFYQWKNKLLGTHDISIEDENMVLRLLICSSEAESVRGKYLVNKRIYEICQKNKIKE